MRWWLPLLFLAPRALSASDVLGVSDSPLVLDSVVGDALDERGDEEGSVEAQRRRALPPIAAARPLAGDLDLLTRLVAQPDGRFRAPRNGRLEAVTIDGPLQEQLTSILRTYETPFAAIVAVEPASGRVLAMAEHSELRPEMRGLCTMAIYPAASVFKIVTAAALLSQGVPALTTECIHGGQRRMSVALLEPSTADTRCLTLPEAMGQSANVVFARLTARFLDPAALARAAKAFRFNTPMPFSVPTEVSAAVVPAETWDLALTGAGFGDVFLSPLHGAVLAAAVANRGVWRPPVLFEDQVGAPGGSSAAEVAVAPEVADALAAMLTETVMSGTARRMFHERGHALPDAVGKTGALADQRPFRDYSWFVGYAPRVQPRVAVAAVIVNEPRWRIRATWLGREALRLSLNRKSADRRSPSPADAPASVPSSVAPSPPR